MTNPVLVAVHEHESVTAAFGDEVREQTVLPAPVGSTINTRPSASSAALTAAV